VANKKRSAAQRQRAKARQQRSAGSAAPSATQPAARRENSQPKGRPPARRSRRWVPWAAVGGVVAVVAIMAVVFATKDSTPSPGPSASSGTDASIAKVTNVPIATLEQIGVPSDIQPPPALPPGTPPVESDGKPVVTYIGAEYCPYCAAERWPVTVALSRFGTFSDLSTTTSAADDVFPNTATLSYYGSSYTSDYLVFSSAETETNEPDPNGGYTHLQDLTPEQEQLITTYDTEQYTGSNGGIPFVMIGNLYAWAGTNYDVGLLKDMTFDQIANELADPNSEIAKAINGSANQITAMICQLTGNQPADVCSAPFIQQAQAALQGQ